MGNADPIDKRAIRDASWNLTLMTCIKMPACGISHSVVRRVRGQVCHPGTKYLLTMNGRAFKVYHIRPVFLI